MRCKAWKPTSDPRLQDFLGTLQSFKAYTPKIPSQGYFIFPEILGVDVNSPHATGDLKARYRRRRGPRVGRNGEHSSQLR